MTPNPAMKEQAPPLPIADNPEPGDLEETFDQPFAVKAFGAILVLVFLVFGITMYTAYERHSSDIPPHRGQEALLRWTAADTIFVMGDEDSCSQAVRALAHNDRSALEAMRTAGKLIPVANGVRVKVLSDWYEQRQVRILEGPMAGKEGWVPHDWLIHPERR